MQHVDHSLLCCLSYSSLMLYFALSCTSVYFPGDFRPGLYFSREYLPWFFHHKALVWAKPSAPILVQFDKLAFLLTSFYSLFSFFPCFRWPVLHMGAEQLWSAGLGQRMSLPSQSTTCQVSWWDPFGSGCGRWSPQFCPLSLRSCVWLGKEQLRTAGTKWWTRY